MELFETLAFTFIECPIYFPAWFRYNILYITWGIHTFPGTPLYHHVYDIKI